MELGHLKAGWVAADDAFGMSPSFREGPALGMRYVLDVPGGTTVWPLEPAWASPEYQGLAPQAGGDSGGPWSSAVMSCRREPGGSGGPGKPGAPQLPVQRPCVQPAGGSPATSTGPSGAGTWTATPLLPHAPEALPWRPWPSPGGRSSRQKSHVGLDRVRDPHLGGVASPRGPMPAGRSFSPESATGLGGRCPGSPVRVPGGAGDAAPGTVRALLRWLEAARTQRGCQPLPCEAPRRPS